METRRVEGRLRDRAAEPAPHQARRLWEAVVLGGLCGAAMFAAPAYAAISCDRIVTANVVAFDKPIMYNRLGAGNINGTMFALRRDVGQSGHQRHHRPAQSAEAADGRRCGDAGRPGPARRQASASARASDQEGRLPDRQSAEPLDTTYSPLRPAASRPESGPERQPDRHPGGPGVHRQSRRRAGGTPGRVPRLRSEPGRQHRRRRFVRRQERRQPGGGRRRHGDLHALRRQGRRVRREQPGRDLRLRRQYGQQLQRPVRSGRGRTHRREDLPQPGVRGGDSPCPNRHHTQGPADPRLRGDLPEPGTLDHGRQGRIAGAQHDL